MSDKPDPILQQKEQQQLKTQLLWRLGIAGTLIASVLGAIAWLDQDEKNAAPEVQIPQIAPAASAIVAASPEPIIQDEVASAPIATEAPAPTVAPTSSPTATPVPAARNAPNQTQIEAISNVPKRQTELAPSKKPTSTPEAYKAASEPTLKLNTTEKTLATTPPAQFPAASSTQLGYSVQAGVFLHSNNAEKLLAQIQAAGIPAYLETRVQIGPFKTK
ncbi:MAG: SPOR domain-containing protein, partial [Deefgea sp.]